MRGCSRCAVALLRASNHPGCRPLDRLDHGGLPQRAHQTPFSRCPARLHPPPSPARPPPLDGDTKQLSQPPSRVLPRPRPQLAEHLVLRVPPERTCSLQGPSSSGGESHRLDAPVGVWNTLDHTIPLQAGPPAAPGRVPDGVRSRQGARDRDDDPAAARGNHLSPGSPDRRDPRLSRGGCRVAPTPGPGAVNGGRREIALARSAPTAASYSEHDLAQRAGKRALADLRLVAGARNHRYQTPSSLRSI